MKPFRHSLSSVKQFGGKVEDYLPIHTWFDESKSYTAEFMHRSMRHHSQGIFQAEKEFGYYITNSDGKEVPVRTIGEQHVKEDMGIIPSVVDWMRAIAPAKWMAGVKYRKE